MQPYLFPYLGYYQMAAAVDRFIFLDHVSFIKKGWINRNRIRGGSGDVLFTVPLKKASQNVAIRDTFLSDEYPRWKDKFLRSLELEYGKAPLFRPVRELVGSIMDVGEAATISTLSMNSVTGVLDYLGAMPETGRSSAFDLEGLAGQEMILAICKALNADAYLNAEGGKQLYDAGRFGREGIALEFIHKEPVQYPHARQPFMDNLSMIDVLMFNEPDFIRTDLLKRYTIHQP